MCTPPTETKCDKANLMYMCVMIKRCPFSTMCDLWTLHFSAIVVLRVKIPRIRLVSFIENFNREWHIHDSSWKVKLFSSHRRPIMIKEKKKKITNSQHGNFALEINTFDNRVFNLQLHKKKIIQWFCFWVIFQT